MGTPERMRPEASREVVEAAAAPTAADERAGAAPQPALLQPGGQPSDGSRRMLRRMTRSPQIQASLTLTLTPSPEP